MLRHNATNELYEFGPYRLEVDRRVVTHDGRPVNLAPKTFELLLLLVRNAGRAFSEQELMAALWPDTFVEEANLTFQVSTLRKALGNGGGRWIETIPKHGYRFASDVTAIAPASPPADLPAAASDSVARPPSLSVRTVPPVLRYAAVAGAVAAVLGVGVWLLTSGRDARPRLIALTSVPVTSFPGLELDPALSPDGNQVAFAWEGEEGGNLDIFVKLIDGGEPVRLTRDPANERAPVWSPDGRQGMDAGSTSRPQAAAPGSCGRPPPRAVNRCR